MKVLLIFIDGLGVGVRDDRINPVSALNGAVLSFFQGDKRGKALAVGGAGFSLDAHLGIPGLPQSATGQTSLLTGENSQALEGRHIVGFPTPKLRDLLLSKNILKEARELGLRSTFINAYRPGIEEMVKKKQYMFFSATTIATLGAGLPFRTLDDLTSHRAVYQEFTNAALIERGYDVPILEPEEAGRIAAAIALDNDFSLFEYFQTDKVGHGGNMEEAVGLLSKLERFLTALLLECDGEEITVLLVSDHGNIEDITTRTHTHHKVMAAAWGRRAQEISINLKSLLDIEPAVLATLTDREIPVPAKIRENRNVKGK